MLGIWSLVGGLIGVILFLIGLVIAAALILGIVLIVMAMMALIKGNTDKFIATVDKIVEKIDSLFL